MKMKIEILYEDTDFLVINKPYGLVVNRAESVKEKTVQDWIDENYGLSKKYPESKIMQERTGICHRIDKDTSGCLVIAKNPEALTFMLGEFKERKVHKKYIALVHGKVEPKEGEVILPMKRNMFDRGKWHVHYEGKTAITLWKVLKYFKFEGIEKYENALSLLEIELKTGRTHQIRVHMSFLGWPLFGDERYLRKDIARTDREYLERHFLHAGEIAFKNMEGTEILVKSELPWELSQLLKKLSSI